MTEYEFLSAIDAAFGFAAEAAMACFAVFGAYVLAAHFAGKSLQYPDENIVRSTTLPPETMLIVMVGPLLLGWVASLVYMQGYVRRSP